MYLEVHTISMNYLAHAYLSFNNTELLLGNMSSDFIKGKNKFKYSTSIQQGIQLHRDIDTFTDYHPVTAEAKKIFKASVGKYSGAFIDVVYDHFLALDTKEFLNSDSLQAFAATTYQQLQANIHFLPLPLQSMIPFMQSQNWLVHYNSLAGIEKSFEGVARRAVYLDDFSQAFLAFKKNYTLLKKHYESFFPDVKKYVQYQIQLLQNQ